MNSLQGEKGLIQHLFYQHNVQQFFVRHIDKYGGIIVPFSIATAFQTGTYGFIRALLAKDRTKQFALDPRTALFQKHWARTNAREPHKRVAAIMGAPFSTVGLEKALTPEDLLKNKAYENVTVACLKYQRGFRVLEQEQKKLEKYRKLLGMDALPEINNPQRFIPPYFQVDPSTNDGWLDVSLRCIEVASTLVPPDQLSVVLHFLKLPKQSEWVPILEFLAKYGVRSVFVYPNKFREHDESETELRNYVGSISLLNNAKLLPEILHGGYFAILLAKVGLVGFGNGVGYSEWRDSGYHKGGTAEIRIYVPKLHRFLDAATAQSLVNKNAEYFASDSELLSEYAGAGKPLTQVTSSEALEHFMECRSHEMSFVESHALTDAISELEQTVSVLGQIGPLEREKLGDSLLRWRNALVG